jgi:PAS domain S-box-containing protein
MASLSWSDRTRLKAQKPTQNAVKAKEGSPPRSHLAGLLLMALAASGVLLFSTLTLVHPVAVTEGFSVITIFLALAAGIASSLMLFLRFIATRSFFRLPLVISFAVVTFLAIGVFVLAPMISTVNLPSNTWLAYGLRLMLAVSLLFACRLETGMQPTRGHIIWFSTVVVLLAGGLIASLFFVDLPSSITIGVLTAPQEILIALILCITIISLLRKRALHDEFLTMLIMLTEIHLIGSVYLLIAPDTNALIAIAGYSLVLFAILLPTLYLQMGMFTTYRYSEQYRLKGREMAINVSSGQELSPIVFREIAKQLSDPLAITDIDGRILFANKALADLSGIDQKALVGMLPSQWQHATVPQDFYSKMFKSVREKRETVATTVKNAVALNPKKSYDASVRITPVLDEFGDIACTILSQQNLSAEQERTNILRQIINTIPLGVMLLDAKDLTLSLVNVQAEYLLGRAGIDLSSIDTFKTLSSHIQKQDRKPYEEDLLPPLVTQQTSKSAEAKDLALFTANDPKPAMVWSMHAVPFLNTEGFLQTILVSFEDIREHQEFDHKMTDFISVASHQLRTPLTGIKWSLDELRKKNETMNAEDRRIIFETCFEASDRMMVTLQQLLQVAELERGGAEKKAMEAVDLKQAIEEGAKGLQPHMTRKNLTFQQSVLKSLPLVQSDRFTLMQMIQNILENAVKYTPENGEIDSILTVKENKISWTLHDTGIGIPKKDLPKVFDKFFRTDNAQKMVPDGTGLGLYIAKSIVERMGGTITIESEEGRGTTVEVILPIG